MRQATPNEPRAFIITLGLSRNSLKVLTGTVAERSIGTSLVEDALRETSKINMGQGALKRSLA